MKIYSYDIEIYKNFFCAIFQNVDDEFDCQEFVVFETRNDFTKLKQFITQKDLTLVGYNILHFDNILLAAILENYSLGNLYLMAQAIVRGEENGDVKQLKWYRLPFKSLDTKEILSLDISLKQTAISMEWYKIQDLPIPFDALIIKEQVPKILSYNANDEEIVVKQYKELKGDIELRSYVNRTYHVDVSNFSEGRIANAIFEAVYSKKTNIPIQVLKEMRTRRDKINPIDCIGKNIVFNSKLKNLIRDLPEDISNFKKTVNIDNFICEMGVGGLHSKDEPGVFIASEDEMIIDADVKSFYPSIMILNGIKPAHLGDDFLDLFKEIYKDRLSAKKGSLKSDVLKIVINAVFGKLGNKDFWFYDPLAFYSVTLSGQLYLLMLIESLMENGFRTISANTDGVTTIVPKSRKDEFDKITGNWQQLTGFSLEFVNYKRYIRRDVNCYLAEKDDGKLKTKGLFEEHRDIPFSRRLMKSYSPAIIPIALKNYFIKDIPVEETVKSSTNIFDFMASQRVGNNFGTYLKTKKGLEKLQKTNRYYVSKNGGVLVKKDKDREISILADVPVVIANEIDKSKSFESYEVYFQYYIDEVNKIITTIKPPCTQLSLF